MTSSRDRTREFSAIIESIQPKNSLGSDGHSSSQLEPSHQRLTAHQQKSLFTRAARKIGLDLASTFARLEQLTILVKKKPIFDDKSNEIQELTSLIRHDMTSLNGQIAKLQELARLHAGSDKKQLQSHSSAVVVGLQSRLAAVSNDFKTVLETRTENLRQAKSRRDLFSQPAITQSAAAMAPQPKYGTVLAGGEGLRERNSQAASAQDDSPSSPLLDGMGQQDRLRYSQQVALIDEQDSYLAERASAMQQIEQTIVELGGIFQQLATMVHQQDELIQRIDTNIESTQMNVEAAHTELLRYFQSISSNRWLMIKVFGVVLVFFLIFVVFML